MASRTIELTYPGPTPEQRGIYMQRFNKPLLFKSVPHYRASHIKWETGIRYYTTSWHHDRSWYELSYRIKHPRDIPSMEETLGTRRYDLHVKATAIVDAGWLLDQDSEGQGQLYRVWVDYSNRRDIYKDPLEKLEPVNPVLLRPGRLSVTAESVVDNAQRDNVMSRFNCLIYLVCSQCGTTISAADYPESEQKPRIAGKIATIPAMTCLVAPKPCEWRAG